MTTIEKPLSGLKVIELHAIGPVPFAGLVLQNLGASITRVSPPSDPGLGVVMDPKFDALNQGKSVLKLDLKNSNGLAELMREIAQADVLLEGFRPGVLERLGLSPELLMKQFPRLIIGRLSGWGSQGELRERAGHDINYLAVSGLLNAIGRDDQPHPPLNVVADFGGGAMHLVVGVLAMLARRGITQLGGVAQTSILAGTIGLTPMFYGLMAADRWNLKRENNLLDGMLPFYRVYRTRDDKFVAVGALENKFYQALLTLMQLDQTLAAKDQFNASTWPHTIARFSETFASKTRDEWAELAKHSDACLSPVLNFTEATTYLHNTQNQWHAEGPQGVNIQNIIQFNG
jgi:alpha-methylacyl-CoA racemase